MQKNKIAVGLILLSVSNSVGLAAATKHIAHPINSRANAHAHPVTAGERLIATGDYDTHSSLLKAITSDNHFAWIKAAPSLTIIRGGVTIHPDMVQEGDKLLCLGKWTGDSDNRNFSATQVKVIGQISYFDLHNKIAVACQNTAQDGPRDVAATESPDVSPTTPDTAISSSPSDDSHKRQAIREYCVAESSRMKVVDSTRLRLLELIDEIESNPDELFLYRDKYFAAINDHTEALNRLRTI